MLTKEEKQIQTIDQKKHILYILSLINISLIFLICIVFIFVRTEIGFNIEEIVFHLNVPLKGTGGNTFSLFFRKYGISIIVFVLALIFLIVLYQFLKKLEIYKRSVICLGIFMFSICILIGILWKAADTLDIFKYLKLQMTSSDFIEKNYVDPAKTQISFPENKRNLIWIYMESMESTFISKKSGGTMKENLIPEMTELAEKNINFSENNRTGGATSSKGTDWTTGGLFAQTSGLPLLLSIGHGDSVEYDKFAPGAVTLGDILEKEGYYQEIMLGSDAVFGGIKSYLDNHGGGDIYDYNTAIEKGEIAKDYFEWWGFEDIKLYSFAKKELNEIKQQEKPFAFSIMTMDTHFSGGYVCKKCKRKHKSTYQDVLNCASRQVTEFVKWLKKQDFYDNTTIVITGDHPTMDGEFIREFYDGSKPRKVYNCFINASLTTSYEKNRKCNTFDFYPTVLTALGVKINGDKLGLGTNLFSGKKTLAERVGYDKIDMEFSKNSKYYNKYIWKY